MNSLKLCYFLHSFFVIVIILSLLLVSQLFILNLWFRISKIDDSGFGLGVLKIL